MRYIRTHRQLYARILGAILLFTFCNAGSVAAAPNARGATDQDGTLVIGGRTRTYHLHVPPQYDMTTPLPLVLVLHGGGGNATSAERETGMTTEADRAGFLVVYPDGTGPRADRLLTWNAYACCGDAERQNVDDVGFLRALVGQLQGDYPVDAKRIYATGLSNGGMMSYRLACEAADLFAAVAPVSASLDTDACAPSQPVSILHIHGTDDGNVPYNGGRGTKVFPGTASAREDRPVAYAIATWGRLDECDPTPVHAEQGKVSRDDYLNGAGGTEVVLYTIRGGGHAWPGGPRLSRLLDAPYPDFDATGTIGSFFATHAKV